MIISLNLAVDVLRSRQKLVEDISRCRLPAVCYGKKP